MRIEAKYMEEARKVLRNRSFAELQEYLEDRGFAINWWDDWSTLFEAACLDYCSHLSDQ